MTKELISVAMCTYNGEKYIKEQLDSIVNQTYKNLEIIIVDDCSTDNTIKMINDYALRDNRIKYFVNEINLGYNKNFELAISLTTGQYIAISDQDDIWELHKLDVLIGNINNHWLVFSNSAWMEEDGALTGQMLLNNFSINGKDYKMVLFTNYMAGHSALFSREFLKYFLPFPEYGFYDWWMIFVALYHYQVIYVDQPLTWYRKHDRSVIQNILVKDNEKLRYNLFKVNLDQYRAFESYTNLKDEDKKFIIEFKKAFALKLKYPYSIPLVKIIYNNYEAVFSESKPRKGLSKLNFAFKNSKRVKDI